MALTDYSGHRAPKKKKKKPLPKGPDRRIAPPKPKPQKSAPAAKPYAAPKPKPKPTPAQIDRRKGGAEPSLQKPEVQEWTPPQNLAELNAIAMPQNEKSAENMLASIINPYFEMNHSYPDVVTTMSLLKNQGNLPQDPEEQKRMYKALWEPAFDADEQTAAELRRGDFFQLSSVDLANTPEYAPFQEGAGKGRVGVGRSGTLASAPKTGQPTLAAYNRTKEYLMNLKNPWEIRSGDALGVGTFSGAEFVAMKHEIARRMKARGVRIPFDPDSTEWDLGWERVANKYVFAGQFAYQVLGTDEQNIVALDVMEKVRSSGGFGRDKLERAARELGIDPVSWSQSDSVASVLSSMRYSTDDTVLTFCYDEFMFSRPIGMSETERRRQYVAEFSEDRLPQEQVAKYAQENKNINDYLASLGPFVGGALKKVKHIPVVGGTLAHMGGDVTEASRAMYLPEITKVLGGALAEAYQSIAIGGAMMEYATTGLWHSEMKAANLARGGGVAKGTGYALSPGDPGYDPEMAKTFKENGLNWAAFIDYSNWQRAHDETEGQQPVARMIESMELPQYGKVRPVMKTLGQGGDLYLSVAIGAKIGDPAWMWAAKHGLKGAATGAKAAHRVASQYEVNWGAIPRLLLIEDAGTNMYSFGGTFGGPKWRVPEAGKMLDEGGYLGEHPAHASPTVTMTPDEYLTMSHEMTKAQADEMGMMHPARPEVTKAGEGGRTNAVAKRLKRGEEVDPAFIDVDLNGNVISEGLQQGDHRAMAAKALGMDEMPVVYRVKVKDGNRWRPATKAEMNDFTPPKTAARPPKEVAPGLRVAPDGSPSLEHPSGAQLPIEVVKTVDGKPQLIEIPSGRYAELPPESRIPPVLRVAEETDHVQWMDDFFANRGVVSEDGKPLKAGYLEEADNTRLSMKDTGDTVTLTKMEVPPEVRGMGHGTRVMDDVVQSADLNGITLRLEAVPFGEGRIPQAKLIDNYKKAGFKEVGNGWMERKPRKIPMQESADAEYARYRRMVDEANEAHGKNPDSPINPAGGERTIYSIGGGLVETIIRNSKGIVTRKAVHTYTSPAWLRTNAELLQHIDSAFQIHRIYGTNEDIPAVVKLTEDIAKSRHPVEIERLLRELETHGIEIDAGAFAGLKAIRYDLMSKGVGQLGPMRLFTTMTTYGKSQPIANSSENLFQVGRAVNYGVKGKAGRSQALADLNEITERLYKAAPGKKQKIVDEFWETFERNLGPEEVAKLKKFQRRITWMRGQRYMENVLGRSYLPVYNKAGEVTERSKVTPGNIDEILVNQQTQALRHYDELWAEREADLADQVNTLERDYYNRTRPETEVPSAAPTAGAWVRGEGERTRTVTQPDGSAYVERQVYNKKTRRYETESVKDVSFRHTGVTTKQGVKGGKELTNARKELARMRTVRDKVLNEPTIQSARYDVVNQARALGATDAEVRSLATAVNDAAERIAMHQLAAEEVMRLGRLKRKLTDAEELRFNRAETVLASYATQQPFKMGQIRTHIVHKYDPRVASWYMTGKGGRAFMQADQSVFEPAMRLFKETVMGNLGFPIRVNVGDEMVRLVPEGVMSRWYTTRRNIKALKRDGTEFTEFELKLRDGFAKDFDTSNTTGEWTALTPKDPGYYQALRDDLASWGREPIVRRLIQSKRGGVGNFPDKASDIKAFIIKMRDERTPDGNLTDEAIAMREFLEDTHRAEGGVAGGGGPLSYNTAMFDEWCDGWETRMQLIAQNPELRKAIRDGASVDELKTFGSKSPEQLWPVNAPLRNTAYGRNGNPLYAINYANPFHYMYKYGTTNMMNRINHFTKTLLFNDRYLTIRNKLVERNAVARADGLPEMSMEEIHQLAGDEAAKHAIAASYNSSTTMFEDMSRNMLPFISAYRQFFVYWGNVAVRHPVSMAAFKANYPDAMQDPFALANGNTQFILPSIPFWGPDPEDGKTGFMDQIKGQLPSASFIPLLPVRVALSIAGEDPKDYASLPGMTGLGGSMPPYQNLAKLLYGLGAPAEWPDSLESLFGDKEKLAKAHANYVLFNTKYGAEGIEATIPEWYKPVAAIFGHWGKEHMKPETIYNLFIKEFNFTPIGAIYAPEPQRNMQGWYADFGQAVKEGDEAAQARIRADNPLFDKELTYREASPQEQVEMRADPKNKDMLKWWVSPYNYDNAFNTVAPSDWSDQFFDNGGKRKSDKELLAAYNNIYVDIYGGHYIKDKDRDRGEPWVGDISLRQAEKSTKALIEERLKWAKGVATQICKERGWDLHDMMYKFKNPGGVNAHGDYTDWGIWNQIVEQKGLKKAEYNIHEIDKVFKDDFSGGTPHDAPYEVSGDELLRAHDLSNWMASPELGRRLVQDSPLRGKMRQTQQELRGKVLEATVQIAGDQWYYMTGEQLAVLRTGITPKGQAKVNLAQLELKKEWNKWHESKAGTDEYKTGRNAYYALQRKMLGGIKGAECLIGGLGDRLEHIPHFNKPDLFTIGGGSQADAQLKDWNNYKKIRDTQMKSKNPDLELVNAAWQKFLGKKAGDRQIEKRQMEKDRVGMWDTILLYAKKYRRELTESYSDYYEDKGNSLATKQGQKLSKQLGTMIDEAVKANKYFARDVKEYFGEDANIAGRLLDWYNY